MSSTGKQERIVPSGHPIGVSCEAYEGRGRLEQQQGVYRSLHKDITVRAPTKRELNQIIKTWRDEWRHPWIVDEETRKLLKTHHNVVWLAREHT